MKRVKAAATQTHLTAAERMSNVSSAFEVVQLNLLEKENWYCWWMMLMPHLLSCLHVR